MKSTTHHVVVWLAGIVVGTLGIALTSPLFVRSYVPRTFDSARGVEVLQPGQSYRWRREGHATTMIGPHGMMGRTSLPDTKRFTIALWGDSQAEGVCVPDEQKLWRQLQDRWNETEPIVEVLPLAQSGQTAVDWIAQMDAVERNLSVDAHLILLTEISDLADSYNAITASESPRKPPRPWMDVVPDFMVHAGRRLLIDPQTGTTRQLRFGWGPMDSAANDSNENSIMDPDDIVSVIQRLRQASSLPIWIAYAPERPQLFYDRILLDDPQAAAVQELEIACQSRGIVFIDVRQPLIDVAQEDATFPHGFHHGRIGSGHLNATGYRVLSKTIAARVDVQNTLLRRSDVREAVD